MWNKSYAKTVIDIPSENEYSVFTHMSTIDKIAFIGLGAMGQRMATRLIVAGHQVSVWSRRGAPPSQPELSRRLAPTARDAVDGADLVLAMVTDDDASRSLWLSPDNGILAAMKPNATAVECSTVTPSYVSELAHHARQAGQRFCEAPVVGSRPHAEAGTLVFITGGDATTIDPLRPVLASMGGAVHHVGATPAAAFAKLVVNALFGVQVTAMAELLGLAKKASLDTAALMELLGGLPVLSGAARASAEGMLAERFDAMFPVDLVAKDFRYAEDAATGVGAQLPVTGAAGRVFDRAREHGLGQHNLTAVAKLFD